MKRVAAAAVLALAAGLAAAAPGDVQADKERLERLMAEQAQKRTQELAQPADDGLIYGRSRAFWITLGLLAAVPVVVVVRRK